ncbi:sucrase ferredoxin [Janibacter melonis]|uniref:sucrase ferredoxin n=1 Tax=Janibacter melonis TaxID=262209 RepID=UPI001918A266|nr:sucrase ferredoxin [Janibacter melonis]
MTLTPADQRWRCSVAARERDDAPIGTAVPAPRWMLVGHPGPWAEKAARTDPVAGVRPALVSRLDAVGARLQLIRPHGRSEDFQAPWPVFLVDCTTGRIGRYTWSEPEDLVEIAAHFAELPEVCTDPLVLVCCHGKKDVCCAVEGRLVARVLDDVLPGSVWETTHLGGDRFAGNLAILPEGSMYGRVDGTSAPDVVVGHLDGVVDLERWRGRCTWSSPEQVAVRDVLAGGVRLADVASARASAAGRHEWDVVVSTGGEEHVRRVRRDFSEPRRLTCGLDLAVMAQWSVAERAH